MYPGLQTQKFGRTQNPSFEHGGKQAAEVKLKGVKVIIIHAYVYPIIIRSSLLQLTCVTEWPLVTIITEAFTRIATSMYTGY